MRVRQPYGLPGLLALLSAEPGYWGSGRWGLQQPVAQVRQVLQLARQGLREYGRRLDALEKQVAEPAWDGDDEPCDSRSVQRERADDDVKITYRSPSEVSREVEDPRLTQRQIQHLFEKLAIHRCSLNVRGYPYSSDVNDQRQRIYPSTELLTRDDVEEAWDDWRNDDGKRLFRRHRGDSDLDEAERRRGRRYENEDERHRDCAVWHEKEADDRRFSQLSQDEFEAIFRRLYPDRVRLSREGYPYIADVHEEQKAMFQDTRPVTSAELERAFNDWDGKPAYRRHARRDDSERASRNHKANGKEDSSEVHVSRGRRWTFRIFDEMLLCGEYRSSDFTTENLPRLAAVNRRLVANGEPKLESDAVLQRVWKEYLVVAARALEEQLRDRDQVDESDEEHEKPRSGMSVEVDLDSAAFEQTEEIAIPFEEPGNGRRRKHE